MTYIQPVVSTCFKLEPLSRSSVDAAVRLHRETLGYSLNSRLGESNLSFLYNLMLQESGCRVVIATSAGKVVGLVSSVLDTDLFKKRAVASMPFWRWIYLAGRLVTEPGVWPEWVQSWPGERPVFFKSEQVKP